MPNQAQPAENKEQPVAKNQYFFNALDFDPLYSTLPIEDRKRALDTLIKAGPGNIDELKDALIAHQDFWRQFRGLNAAFVRNAAVDLFDPASAPSAKLLCQKASEKRVILGLDEVAEDVLVSILSLSDEEARAYIAAQAQLGPLTQAPNWITTPASNPAVNPPVAAKNQSTEVLSDSGIEGVRVRARELLLLSLAQQSQDVELINNILNASNVSELQYAAQALGCPRTPNILFTYPLEDALREQLHELIVPMQKSNAKNAFTDYVNTMDETELALQKSLLIKDGQAFIDSLPQGAFEDLDVTEVDWARGLLGARYLTEIVLKNNKTKVLVPALNATNAEELKTQLNQIFRQHNYIDFAVNSENFASVQKLILQNHIRQNILDIKQLKLLDRAVSLVKFKEALRGIGISAGWLDNSDLEDIKQVLRSRHFELVTQSGSHIPHWQLLSTLFKLPVYKQRELLDNPKDFHLLLNAQEPSAITHYLGANVEGVEELAEESRRLANFKQIHNAAIAKILANFEPDIHLDLQHLSALNQELATASLNDDYFNQEDQYKALVDRISNCCIGGVTSPAFYRAFGLNEDGIGFKEPALMWQHITTQNNKNKALFQDYMKPTVATVPPVPTITLAHKELLGLFLSLELDLGKTAQEIRDAFDASNTVEEFITQLIPSAAPSSADLLKKTSLTYALPLDKFNQIKNLVSAEKFLSTDATVVSAATDKVISILETAQNSHRDITKDAERFVFLKEMDNLNHLYNPEFHSAAKEHAGRMKKHYQMLADDCELIIKQLNWNQFILKEQLKGIPDASDIKVANPEKQTIISLCTSLNSELTAIDEDLEFYLLVKDKLSGKEGVLEAINDALDSKKDRAFSAEGVSWKTYKANEVPEFKATALAPTAVPPVPLAGVSIASPNVDKGILEGLSLPLNQVGVCTVNTKLANFESSARIMSYPPTNTSSAWKVEIGSPSVQITPAPPARDEASLLKADMELAFKAARIALGKLKNAPSAAHPLVVYGSDKKQMRYLWTALVILGENNPHMQFKPDALKVDATSSSNNPNDIFDPSQEKGFLFGFKSNSLYNDFKQLGNELIARKEIESATAIFKKRIQIMDELKTLEPEVVKNASTFFQEERKKIQKELKEHGPAPRK